jgi:hypothetical protein
MKYKVLLERIFLDLANTNWKNKTIDLEEPKYYNIDKKITLEVKKTPYKTKQGGVDYIYKVLKNGQKIAVYDRLSDAEQSLIKQIKDGN